MSGRGPGVALALPRTTDGRPILTRADLDEYDPHGQVSGGRVRYYCPIHGGDHQRSLSVDVTTGSYLCHTCKAAGLLREHWRPGDNRPARRAPAPSLAEIGRRELARRAQAEVERGARLAGESIPPSAAAFLARLPLMQEALRAPSCPGHVYLRGRGLDPLVAADHGAGYSPPDAWPGDRGRRHGRIVYPLADPASGRLVSALGRLCVDPVPTWSSEACAAFRAAKQRKLPGCGAGVWPYSRLAEARQQGAPLILVEGPADALALLQSGLIPPYLLALCGTANVLTADAVRGLAGVVLALDDDEAGRKGRDQLRMDLALAGLPTASVEPGWLGVNGAHDPADLAARRAADPNQAAVFERAMTTLAAVYRRLQTPPWDDERAAQLLAAMYERCSAAYDGAPMPKPQLDDALEDAIDAAYLARDLVALEAALDACADDFLARCRARGCA